MPMSIPTCSVSKQCLPHRVGEGSEVLGSQTLSRLLDKMEELSLKLADLSTGQHRVEAAIGEVQESLGALARAPPAACVSTEPVGPQQEPHPAPLVPLQAEAHSYRFERAPVTPTRPSGGSDAVRKERNDGTQKRTLKAFTMRACQTANDLSAVEGWKLKTRGGEPDRFEGSEDSMSARLCAQKKKGPQSLTERIVASKWFGYAMAFLILANSVLLGFQVQLMAVNTLQTPPEVFSHSQWAFTALFLAELLLRLRVDRWKFFTSAEAGWNCFDLVVVGLSIVEVLLDQIMNGTQSANNLTVLRVVRVVRIVRVIRAIRVLRFFRELRVMVYSILGSLLSLFWAMALLFVILFVAAVFFTQIATSYRADPASDERVSLGLARFFSTLFKAMFYLLQGVLGGINWGEIAEPLAELHWFYALLLSFFVCFSLLVLLNIVTGVFVEGAIAKAQNDKEAKIQDQLEEEARKVQQLEEVFGEMDTAGSGYIVLEDFQRLMDDPRVLAYFRTMGLDISKAFHLFRLLDLDNSKSVSTSEFIMGCLRMQGGAKNVDVATLMYENKRMMMKWVIFMDFVEENFNNILDAIQEHVEAGPPCEEILQRRSSWRQRLSQGLSTSSLNVY